MFRRNGWSQIGDIYEDYGPLLMGKVEDGYSHVGDSVMLVTYSWRPF